MDWNPLLNKVIRDRNAMVVEDPLVDLLAEIVKALVRLERPSEDEKAVRDICERIGYGRVMQIASEAWQERDPIGALTIGPAVGYRGALYQ